MSRPVRIQTVQPLEGFKLRLQFTNGSQRVVDVGPLLRGPIFEPIKTDPDYFRTVRVDPRMGTVVWDNGADIDPDVLYRGLTPAWMQPDPAPGGAQVDSV